MPTVVFGYFALLFVTPLLQKLLPDLPGFNMLSAGIVIGIMIIPYVSSLSEDAMRAVPVTFAKAPTPWARRAFQTAIRVLIPGGLLRYRFRLCSGIFPSRRGNHGGCHRRRPTA